MNTILHKLKLPVALMMVFCAVSVNLVMGQSTWNGSASNDWNVAGNWTGGIPALGTNVTIPATTNKPNLSAAGACGNITFTGSSTITFSGIGALTTNGVTITTNNSFTASISCPLIFSSATTTFSFGNATSNLTVSGVISGSSNISKTGAGTLTLSGLNTYTGTTAITAGTLKLGLSSSGSNSPLGDPSSGTTVSSGATLDLNGFNLSTAESLSISGIGVSSRGALSNSAVSAVNYNGPITVAAASAIGTSNGSITINSVTGTFELTKLGTGTLILGSGVSSIDKLKITAGTITAGADLTIANSLIVNGVLEMSSNSLNVTPFGVGGSNVGQIRTSNTTSSAISTNSWFPKVVFYNPTGGQIIPAGGYSGGLQMANTSGIQVASGDISGSTLEIQNTGTRLNLDFHTLQFTTYSINSGAILDMGIGSLTIGDFTSMLGTVRFSDITNGFAIPSGTVEYYGDDQLVGAGEYNNLIINQGSGNATLDNSTVVTVNGNLSLTAGTLIIGTNALFANGGITSGGGNLGGDLTSNLILGGTTGAAKQLYFDGTLAELGRLTLNHSTTATTTTLNTPLSIYSGIVFGSSSDILNLNAQNLILKSSADSTAFISAVPTSSLIGASNVTAERYISAKRAWRLLTMPVTGQNIRDAWAGAPANDDAPTGESAGSGTLITGNNFTSGTAAQSAGYDWFTGLGSTTTSSIRFYTPASVWGSASNTPLTTAAGNSKEGFMLYVRGDRLTVGNAGVSSTTLKPNGTIRQGTISVAVPDALTVVGNPYAASINLNSVFLNTGNSSNINRNFWVWDAKVGTSGAYASLSWNGVDSYDLGGAGTYSVDEYLTVNSGQAFFVEKSGTGNIDITESNKTTDLPAAVLRPTGNNGVSKIGISLYKATGSVLVEQTDKAIARYNDIYQQAGTETFDAAKIYNFSENLSLVRNNRYLSIESRPLPTQNDTLYVPFWNLAQRDYAFEINSSNFIGINQTARLIDAFTNTETVIDLFDGSITYLFKVTSDPASSSLSRFKIVMAPAVVLAVNCTKFDASLIGKKVKLSWSTGCEVGANNFVVERSSNGVSFDEIGRVDAKNSATGASYQLFDNQPINGKNFYRIRSNDKAGHFAYTSIALIQLSSKQSIQVIPTVIDNKHFTLTLNQQPAGKYNLSLSNVAGQQVFQTTVINTGLSSTHQIDLSSGVVPKGIYHLSVTDEQGNKQNIRLLINN